MGSYRDNAPYGSYAYGYYLHPPGPSTNGSSNPMHRSASDGALSCRIVMPPPALNSGHQPRWVFEETGTRRRNGHARPKRRERRSDFNADARPFRPSPVDPAPGTAFPRRAPPGLRPPATAPGTAPPGTAPPGTAPPGTAPGIAPPGIAPSDTAPSDTAPPDTAPPDTVPRGLSASSPDAFNPASGLKIPSHPGLFQNSPEALNAPKSHQLGNSSRSLLMQSRDNSGDSLEKPSSPRGRTPWIAHDSPSELLLMLQNHALTHLSCHVQPFMNDHATSHPLDHVQPSMNDHAQDFSQGDVTNGLRQGLFDPYASSSTAMNNVSHPHQAPQINPYSQNATAGNNASYYQSNSFAQQPLQYHLYSPLGPHRETLLPYQRTTNDFFISDTLREDLQRKSAATQQILPSPLMCTLETW